MKLDTNCVRDILFLCENSLGLDENLSWKYLQLSDFCSHLTKYSKEIIAYTLILLDEAGYIESAVSDSDDCIDDIYVSRLTYAGHEFIETIRPDSVWKKVSSVVATIGSASLPIVQNLGSKFLLEALTLLESAPPVNQ